MINSKKKKLGIYQNIKYVIQVCIFHILIYIVQKAI